MKIIISEAADGFSLTALDDNDELVTECYIHHELDLGVSKMAQFFRDLGMKAKYEEDY